MNNLFLNRYPYTDFHELNLSWLIQVITEVQTTLEQFVSINALKYADPIQWNITTQYEKNTIVIDPVSGVAYISVQPVPAGVALTNTDYWTVVFDLGQFVVRASKNFSINYESDTTTTATFASTAGAWLVWGDTLYKALVNITPGDTYVVNGNIQHFTMEELVGHLEDLNTTDKTSIVNAINDILVYIGDLSNLTTPDNSSIVDAVNSLVTIIGDLADLTTSDTTSIVNAINSVLSDMQTIVGDLNDLNTSDKDSVVDAINEVLSATISNQVWISPEMFGAVGDGVTDDSLALQDMFDNAETEHKSVLLTPGKTYLFQNVVVHSNTYVEGSGATLLKISADSPGLHLTHCLTVASTGYNDNENIYLHNIVFDGNSFTQQTDALIGLMHNKNIVIDGCTFTSYHNNHMIECNSSKNVYIINCKVRDNLATGALASDITRTAINIDYATNTAYPGMQAGAYDTTPCDNIFVTNCDFDEVMCAVDSHGAYYDNGWIRHSNIHVDNIKVNNSFSIIHLRTCGRVWISNIKATNISFAGTYPWGIALRGCYGTFIDGVLLAYCGNTTAGNPIYIDNDTVDGNTTRSVAITLKNYSEISDGQASTIYVNECTGLKIESLDIYNNGATHAININENCYDIHIISMSIRGTGNGLKVGTNSTVMLEGFETQNLTSLFDVTGILYPTNGRVNTKTWSGSGTITPQNVRTTAELFNSPILAGHRSVGSVAGGTTAVLTMTPTTMSGNNAEIIATFESSASDSPEVSISIQNKTSSSFDLVITNHGANAVSGRINWIMMNPQMY